MEGGRGAAAEWRSGSRTAGGRTHGRIDTRQGSTRKRCRRSQCSSRCCFRRRCRASTLRFARSRAACHKGSIGGGAHTQAAIPRMRLAAPDVVPRVAPLAHAFLPPQRLPRPFANCLRHLHYRHLAGRGARGASSPPPAAAAAAVRSGSPASVMQVAAQDP